MAGYATVVSPRAAAGALLRSFAAHDVGEVEWNGSSVDVTRHSIEWWEVSVDGKTCENKAMLIPMQIGHFDCFLLFSINEVVFAYL